MHAANYALGCRKHLIVLNENRTNPGIRKHLLVERFRKEPARVAVLFDVENQNFGDRKLFDRN